MTLGAAQSARSDTDPTGPNAQSRPREPVRYQPEAEWNAEVLDLLKQMLVVQKEVAEGQLQVIQQLGTLATQVGQLHFHSE